MHGTAHCRDGRSLRVAVSNLSYDGCQIMCDVTLRSGEVIRLSLPNMGDIEAQVRWSEDNQAGLTFLTGRSELEGRRARLGV